MELKEIKSKLEKKVPAFAAKVQPIYKLLNWEWSPGKSEPHIPSVGEIENALYGLIDGLREGYYSHGAGGLEAYYCFPDKESGEPGEYGLKFTLSVEEFFD